MASSNENTESAKRPKKNVSDHENEEAESEKGRAVDNNGACADIIRSPETMAKLELIAAEQELQASSSLSPLKPSTMTGKDTMQGPSTTLKPKHAKAGSMIVFPSQTQTKTDDLISERTQDSKKKASGAIKDDDTNSMMKKRKRKKKGPADPQEAMNAFIRDQF